MPSGGGCAPWAWWFYVYVAGFNLMLMNALLGALKIVSKATDTMIVNHKAKPVRTIYIHGTWFDSCESCDSDINDINPGKEWSYINNGTQYTSHVCDKCFSDPDYQEMMSRRTVTEVKKFNQ